MHSPTRIRFLPLCCYVIDIKPNSPYWSFVLHIKYGHRPLKTLPFIIDNDHIKVPKVFPKKLAQFPGHCPICDMVGWTKVPGGLCVDMTELPMEYRWYMDFTLFSRRSICGFIASLTIIDVTSSMTFELPWRNKHPPHQYCWLFLCPREEARVFCEFLHAWMEVVSW